MEIEFCQVGPNPEDPLPLDDGSVITGLDDGRLVRIGPDFTTVETIATTSGRPLGLDLAPDGRVVYCDTELGVWACDPGTGGLEKLVDSFEGERLNFCNNPCVADDGSIWFSTSSRRHDLAHYTRDLIENRPSGRLFHLATDGTLTCRVDELAFGNGVVITADRSAVLVAETGAQAIRRHWLTGDRAGTTDHLVEGLPGFPDNLALTPEGQVLVALPAPFTSDLERLLKLPFAARWALARVPERLQPKAEQHLMASLYEPDGTLVASIDLTGVGFDTVTGVRVTDDWVYLGTIAHDRLARIPRSALR